MNEITCVYCGFQYPEGTPQSGHPILTEHIKVCEKHPMKKLTEDNQKLRAVLVKLVGVDNLEELREMVKSFEAIETLMGKDPDRDAAKEAAQVLIEVRL